MTSSSSQSVAITGAGAGLGRDIALGLAAKGYVIFGTAMSATEVQDLKDASGGRVSLTVCDITKEQAVKAWAGDVSDALGNAGLNLLISNAGILTPGPLEVLPLDTERIRGQNPGPLVAPVPPPAIARPPYPGLPWGNRTCETARSGHVCRNPSGAAARQMI